VKGETNGKMIRCFVVFFCSLVILSAGCKTKSRNQATISGQFIHAAGEKIILLELDTKSIRRIDSTSLDAAGKFAFRTNPEEPGFYMLQSQQGKVLVLYADKGNTITLSGDYSSFPDGIIVNGPKEAELLEEFFRFTRKNEKKVDSLENLLMEGQERPGYDRLTAEIDSVFKNIWYNQREFEKAFIDRNPASLVSLIVLNYAFGRYPVLSPEEDSVYYLKLDQNLMSAFPDNKHVRFHHQRVLEYQREKAIKQNHPD